MTTVVSLATSDFREMRVPGTFYADKTHFIRDLLDLPNKAVLFARPRRFGARAGRAEKEITCRSSTVRPVRTDGPAHTLLAPTER